MAHFLMIFRGLKWENAVVDRLTDLKSYWKIIKVSFLTFRSETTESEKNVHGVMPYFVLSISLMVLFIICTSYTGNWVTSKCLVSGFGIISMGLGVFASTGVLIMLGLPMVGMFNAVLFVALGN